jgi:hypothetical protein
MTAGTLLDEWDQALSAMRPHADRLLRAHGIDIPTEQRAGGIGYARIQTVGRLFHHDPADFEAICVGLWAPEPPNLLYAATSDWGLMDVLAFDPEAPTRWWYRCGDVEHPYLGEHHLNAALDQGAWLQVHDNPWSWLQHGARGVVDLGYAARFRHRHPFAMEVAA